MRLGRTRVRIEVEGDSGARRGGTAAHASAVSRDATPATAGDGPLALGTMVGRYVVTATLVRGATGVVHLAHDSELMRKVALAVPCDIDVADRPSAGHDGAPSPWLARARSLARLRHRNLVPVYDFGTDADRVWIAFEHAGGRGLAAWLRARPRHWRELEPLLLAAAQGLAALHDAGVVHGAITPAAVIVGDDGRVRVGGFDAALVGAVADEGAALACRAPEATVDARSDQYAWCATAWHAITGAWPPVAARPIVAGVPRAAIALLQRGLLAEPAQRFGDMAALLEAFARARTRRRRRVALAGTTVFAGLALALGLRSDRPACARSLPSGWTAAERTATVDAVTARLGPRLGTAAVAAIDRVQHDAADAAHQVCEATQVRGEGSPARRERREDCVAQAWAEALATAAWLRESEVPTEAQALLDGLSSPAACAAAGGTPLPEALREAWAQAAVARRSGAVERAGAAIDAMLAEALAREHGRAIALARHERALLLRQRGDAEATIAALLVEVIADARRDGDVTLEASAWLALGEGMPRDDDGRAGAAMCGGMAEALLQPGDDPRLFARARALRDGAAP